MDGSAGDTAAVDAGPTVCERCGAGFHCGARDAHPCACMGLQLDGAQRAALSERYRHCLCVRCLAQIAAGASAEPEAPPPAVHRTPTVR